MIALKYSFIKMINHLFLYLIFINSIQLVLSLNTLYKYNHTTIAIESNTNSSLNFVKHYELNHNNFSLCELLCQKDTNCVEWRLFFNSNLNRNQSNNQSYYNILNDTSNIINNTANINKYNDNKYDCFLQSESMLNIIRSLPHPFYDYDDDTITSVYGTKINYKQQHDINSIHSDITYGLDDLEHKIQIKTLVTTPIAIGTSHLNYP